MGPNTKYYLTQAELNWIVMALQHDIAAMRDECSVTDSDGVRKLGFMAIENREKLVTRIMDMMSKNAKHIEVA